MAYRKTGTGDPTKTGKPGTGTVMGPYKNRKTGTPMKPSENLNSGARCRSGGLRLETFVNHEKCSGIEYLLW